MVHFWSKGKLPSMTRSICSYAGLLLIALCLSGILLAQTKVQPATPTGLATVAPSSASASDSDKAAAAESPTGKVHQDHMIRIGTGDLLQITVYGAPDLTTEARVNDAGNITMALIGSVYLAGLTSDQAQQLIATRLRDGGFLRDPQVAVFEKEYASQGIAVMGEVQKPGIYTLFGKRRLYDAISAAGGTTARAGRAVTITHPVEPNKPLIVDMDFMDPSRSPAGNVEVSPGDTVVVSRAGVVYVVGITGSSILRQTSNGVQEIPIPLNKSLAAKAPDTPLQAEDVLFVPTSMGKSAAITGAQTALALVTGLAIYGKF